MLLTFSALRDQKTVTSRGAYTAVCQSFKSSSTNATISQHLINRGILLKLPKGVLKLERLTGVKRAAWTQNASPTLQMGKRGQTTAARQRGAWHEEAGNTKTRRDGNEWHQAWLGQKHWNNCQFGVLQNGLFSRVAWLSQARQQLSSLKPVLPLLLINKQTSALLAGLWKSLSSRYQ